MMETIQLGTQNRTLHVDLETGAIGYSCRCGEIHRGVYAFEDFQHHDCLHPTRLLALDEGQVLCPLCGMAWAIETP